MISLLDLRTEYNCIKVPVFSTPKEDIFRSEHVKSFIYILFHKAISSSFIVICEHVLFVYIVK